MIVAVYNELEVPVAARPSAADAAQVSTTARTLALMSIADILVFFAVLLVGFAYVWRASGDLDRVRALSLERGRAGSVGRPHVEEEEPALV